MKFNQQQEGDVRLSKIVVRSAGAAVTSSGSTTDNTSTWLMITWRRRTNRHPIRSLASMSVADQRSYMGDV